MAAGNAVDEDERRRRRLLWLWFGLALVILMLLFVVCTSGTDNSAPAPVPAARTTTAAGVALPAPTSPAPEPDIVTTRAPAPARTGAPRLATTAAPPPPTTEAGPIDVSGVWTFIINVTETRGACAGEEDEPVDPDTVTIQQDGDVLTVTGLNGTGPPWFGQITGNQVTFAGERDEDDGRTTALFVLTVDDAGTVFGGIEEWTWSGPGGSCPDSLSDVTANRT